MAKNKILSVIAFLFIFPAYALDKPVTVTSLHKNLTPLLTEYWQKQPPKKNQTYFKVYIETEKPRPAGHSNWGNGGYPVSKTTTHQDWADTVITIFSDKKGNTSQMALESYGCNIERNLDNQKEVQERFENTLEQVALTLFAENLKVSDGDFKKLGPDWIKIVRVPIKSSIKDVRKMRLSRGLYKCDGKSGYGFRFDFFF